MSVVQGEDLIDDKFILKNKTKIALYKYSRLFLNNCYLLSFNKKEEKQFSAMLKLIH